MKKQINSIVIVEKSVNALEVTINYYVMVPGFPTFLGNYAHAQTMDIRSPPTKSLGIKLSRYSCFTLPLMHFRTTNNVYSLFVGVYIASKTPHLQQLLWLKAR